MRPIQRIIATGFATAAIASASLPALSGTVWPDVDFEWYANVGKTGPARAVPNTEGRIQRIDANDPRAPRIRIDDDTLRDSRDTVIVPVEPQPAQPVQAAPLAPDTQPTNPTLPYTGSNRR